MVFSEGGPGWHVFLDTDQLIRQRHVDGRVLGELRKRCVFDCYVLDVVAEEYVFNRAGDVPAHYGGVREADAASALKALREELRELLTRRRISLVRGSPVTLTAEDVAIVVAHRYRAGFRDGLVWASLLSYAERSGLKGCLFVTEDQRGFPLDLLRQLGHRRGVWLTPLKWDDAIKVLDTTPEHIRTLETCVENSTAEINAWLRGQEVLKRQLLANGKGDIEAAIERMSGGTLPAEWCAALGNGIEGMAMEGVDVMCMRGSLRRFQLIRMRTGL